MSLFYAGRVKYYKKGMKLYAPVIGLEGRPRYLRRHFETATEAERYGQKVAKKYRRMLAQAARQSAEAVVTGG